MNKQSSPSHRRRNTRVRLYSMFGGVVIFGLILVGAWYFGTDRGPQEAPEAAKVLAAQSNMPFQILIPAYMPRQFRRVDAEIKVDKSGPGGEPEAEIAYHTATGESLFITQWLPGNAQLEILSGSRPVQTKWGKGYLLSHGGGLVNIWVDIGPLRVSIMTNTNAGLTREDLLEMANTLGPASNQQVFYYTPDKPLVKDAPLPPPEEIKINDQGVQEYTLVITPGGYTPMRFSLKKGVPAKMTFRQLGEVGCGDTLLFPADPRNPSALQLKSEADKAVLEFTPQAEGNFEFFCSHYMFRGILTVRP